MYNPHEVSLTCSTDAAAPAGVINSETLNTPGEVHDRLSKVQSWFPSTAKHEEQQKRMRSGKVVPHDDEEVETGWITIETTNASGPTGNDSDRRRVQMKAQEDELAGCGCWPEK